MAGIRADVVGELALPAKEAGHQRRCRVHRQLLGLTVPLSWQAVFETLERGRRLGQDLRTNFVYFSIAVERPSTPGVGGARAGARNVRVAYAALPACGVV